MEGSGGSGGLKQAAEKRGRGKNKRVVDSFTLQRPILDYISGSCFLCAAFYGQAPRKEREKKKPAKISFNLPQKLKCPPARPPRLKQGRQLSDIAGETTLIISLSAAVRGRWRAGHFAVTKEGFGLRRRWPWETAPLPESRVRVRGRQTPPPLLLSTAT